MSTSADIDYITRNLLYVDKEALVKSIDTRGLDATVRTWGSKTDSYDNLMVAGRLYMMHSSKNFAKSILEYTTKLKHRLHPDIIKFMQQHQKILDEEIKSRSDFDLDVDWLAAGTFIKTYLAKGSMN